MTARCQTESGEPNEMLAKRIETNPLGWLPGVGDCINFTFTPEEATRVTAALRGGLAQQPRVWPKEIRSLVNEIVGVWDAFELGIRQEISNTNYACVREKLTAVEALLETSGGDVAASSSIREAHEAFDRMLRNNVIEECAKIADLAADTLRRDAAKAQSLGVDCSDSGGTLDHYAGMYEGMASLIRALKTSSVSSAEGK